MADITNLFKATLKTVKARQKVQGVNVGPDKSILGHAKRGSGFSVKSKEVVENISKLKDFLLQHQKDYINAAGPMTSQRSHMTDAERDQIDSEAETFMKTCSEAIRLLRREACMEADLSTQAERHRDEVGRLLEVYLKAVCQIYSTQRAIRVKRIVTKKKIARLEPDKQRLHSVDSFVARLEEKSSKVDESLSKNEAGSAGSSSKVGDSGDKTNRPSRLPVTPSLHLFGEPEEEEELSPEEVQLLEEENHQLYEEMNSMVDEIKNIEDKVVEISKLQEVFANKVLEQETDIDRVADTVVGTTENIKEANEEIREAMKNNAGLRVWILFFLIVCSLSLLFLDWYNP